MSLERLSPVSSFQRQTICSGDHCCPEIRSRTYRSRGDQNAILPFRTDAALRLALRFLKTASAENGMAQFPCHRSFLNPGRVTVLFRMPYRMPFTLQASYSVFLLLQRRLATSGIEIPSPNSASILASSRTSICFHPFFIANPRLSGDIREFRHLIRRIRKGKS